MKTTQATNSRPINVAELGQIQYSGDIRIDALLDGHLNWNFLTPGRNVLYYTFNVVSGNAKTLPGELVAFNASQIVATHQLLAYAAKLTGIEFVETKDGTAADIHFAATDLSDFNMSGLTQTTYTYSYGGNTVVSYQADAYVYLDNREFFAENSKMFAGSPGYETLLHEVGHALGLGHPFSEDIKLPSNLDNTQNTVMSYNSQGGNKATFQAFDVATLKWIYGGDGLGGLGHYRTNHVPTGNSIQITTKEDTAYSFGVNSFPFKDGNAGDMLRAIQIINLPTHGQLKLNGGVVKLEQIVDAKDLATNALKFIPKANEFGSQYASFTFKVGDGMSFSSKIYAAKVSVTPVIDHLNLKGGVGHDLLVGDKIDKGSNDVISGLMGNDTLRGLAGSDILVGGEGHDKLYGGLGNDKLNGGNGRDFLQGGLGRDKVWLTEKILTKDTVYIAEGESTVKGFDQIFGFGLGNRGGRGVDQLDLVSNKISASVLQADGKDYGVIRSHHIAKGLVSFDDVNGYRESLPAKSLNFMDAVGYLKANITGQGETVVFNSGHDSYVFQNQGAVDTLVKLVGDIATGLSLTAQTNGAVWLV